VDFTIMHNCGGVTDVTAQLSVPSKNREAPRTRDINNSCHSYLSRAKGTNLLLPPLSRLQNAGTC
jgi:hypothetical protein